MPYWMKLAIAVAVTFLSAWIPLVGSYHYETSLATALLGLVCIPFLAPRVAESTPDDKAKTIAKCIGACALESTLRRLAGHSISIAHSVAVKSPRRIDNCMGAMCFQTAIMAGVIIYIRRMY